MRTFLKNAVVWQLAILSRAIVRKYKPQIVMVTGSVGKTSTKDAIAAVLAQQFRVRASEKSQNSEFGVPLTIIGAKNPWANAVGWLQVLGRAWLLLLTKREYPELLVLEVGADQPGDLKKILRIAKPDVVVVTLLPEIPVHVEFYATPAEVREEEFRPAMALPAGAPLIINANDRYALELATQTAARVYTFGTTTGDVCIENPAVWTESGNAVGMQADIAIEDGTHQVRVRDAFGEQQFFAPAAAAAAGLALKMTPKQIYKGLERYNAPPGRGRLFAGIKNTLLIDDSYNASPVAMEAALNSLVLLPGLSRKVAILGDMLELGRYSHDQHHRIGALAGKSVDYLITVGRRAQEICVGAMEAGLDEEKVIHFSDSKEAAKQVPELIQKGDVILFKGSQSGVRLERIVKVLLANPEDAVKLVRQEGEWQKR